MPTDPLVLMVSPTGARRTKADHPSLPMTPDEIARATAESVEAGASMVHLHVRDAEGKHSLEVGFYRTALVAIERECGPKRVIVQITSEAVGVYSAPQQMECVRALCPEAVSIALKELIPDEAAERPAADFARWMIEEWVAVQWIVYSPDELRRYFILRERDVLTAAPGTTLMLVLGRYTDGQQSDPRGLLDYLTVLGDAPEPWMVCAFGARESAVMLAAGALGGHARVGFENNLHLADGSLAATPAALVRQCAEALPLVGRSAATIAEARALFCAR